MPVIYTKQLCRKLVKPTANQTTLAQSVAKIPCPLFEPRCICTSSTASHMIDGRGQLKSVQNANASIPFAGSHMAPGVRKFMSYPGYSDGQKVNRKTALNRGYTSDTPTSTGVLLRRWLASVAPHRTPRHASTQLMTSRWKPPTTAIQCSIAR